MTPQSRKDADMPAKPKHTRLFDLLSRFAEQCETRSGRCSITVRTTDDALRAVLTEIDETVLPRKLSLTTEAQRQAVLTVANRRLVGFETPGGAGAPVPETCTGLPAVAAWYVERITAFLEGAGELSIAVVDHRPRVAATSLACPAGLLAEAAGIALAAPTARTSFEDLVEALKRLSTAWVWSSPSLPAPVTSGPGDLVARAQVCAHAAQAAGASRRRKAKFKPGVPTCTLLSLAPDLRLAMLDGEGGRLVALLPAERTKDVQRCWTAFIG